MAPLNASCARCYTIILDLCGRFLDIPNTSNIANPEADVEPPEDTSAVALDGTALESWMGEQPPVGESPQTQINSVFSMMWPNVPPLEAADVVMGDDAGWMEFLRAGSVDGWTGPPS